MTTVLQIIKSKPNQQVLSVRPDQTVFEAIELMSEKNVGALLVMEGGHVVGIVTERDYARKVILAGRSSRQTLVREIMSSPVRCVPPETKNEECMALMTEHRLRHLPVQDDATTAAFQNNFATMRDTASEPVTKAAANAMHANSVDSPAEAKRQDTAPDPDDQ